MKRVVSTKRQPGGEGGILQIRGAIVFLHISNALRTWSTWFCVECVVWGYCPRWRVLFWHIAHPVCSSFYTCQMRDNTLNCAKNAIAYFCAFDLR